MIFSYLLNMQSHPSWVCGLKHPLRPVYRSGHRSHPSWVCGLKLIITPAALTRTTVTPFVGVWIETQGCRGGRKAAQVTPFVGVWIETPI